MDFQALGQGTGVITAVVAFAATEVDTLVVLTVFFADAKVGPGGAMTGWQVCAGQYLGLTVIIAVSLVGYIIGSFIDRKYIGVLGLVPILMGLKGLVGLCYCKKREEEDTESSSNCSQADRQECCEEASSEEVKRREPQSEEGSRSREAAQEADPDHEEGHTARSCVARAFQKVLAARVFQRVFTSGVIRVAGFALVNGFDNVCVYAPLFADSHGWKVGVMVFVFYAMLGVWCILGWALVRVPRVTDAIKDFGPYIVPVLLIGLGVYIIFEGNSQTLIGLRAV